MISNSFATFGRYHIRLISEACSVYLFILPDLLEPQNIAINFMMSTYIYFYTYYA